MADSAAACAAGGAAAAASGGRLGFNTGVYNYCNQKVLIEKVFSRSRLGFLDKEGDSLI